MMAALKVLCLKKKAAWITEEILEQQRYRERLRAKARRSNREEDYKEWKTVRKRVSRLVNDGRKKYLQAGLNDQLNNSASTWRGVEAHLG